MRSRLPVLSAWMLAAGPLAAVTVVLEPVRDNTLYEAPAPSGDDGAPPSNGAGQYLFAGQTLEPFDAIRRGLVAFDVAGTVPAGATITDVVLTLQMSRTVAGPATVELRSLLADWGEGTSDAPGEEGAGTPAQPGDATWHHTFFDSDFWALPGGDFAPFPSAAQSVADMGPYSWGSTPEMVADVQGWLDDPASNFGWLLLGDESTRPTAKRFDSREGSGTPPRLTVTYLEPVPAAPLAALGLLLAVLLAIGLRRQESS